MCIFSRPKFQKILPTLQNFDETKSRFHNQLIEARNWFDSKKNLVCFFLLHAIAFESTEMDGGKLIVTYAIIKQCTKIVKLIGELVDYPLANSLN